MSFWNKQLRWARQWPKHPKAPEIEASAQNDIAEHTRKLAERVRAKRTAKDAKRAKKARRRVEAADRAAMNQDLEVIEVTDTDEQPPARVTRQSVRSGRTRQAKLAALMFMEEDQAAERVGIKQEHEQDYIKLEE